VVRWSATKARKVVGKGPKPNPDRPCPRCKGERRKLPKAPYCRPCRQAFDRKRRRGEVPSELQRLRTQINGEVHRRKLKPAHCLLCPEPKTWAFHLEPSLARWEPEAKWLVVRGAQRAVLFLCKKHHLEEQRVRRAEKKRARWKQAHFAALSPARAQPMLSPP
jgi:hypothetical protein